MIKYEVEKNALPDLSDKLYAAKERWKSGRDRDERARGRGDRVGGTEGGRAGEGGK